MSQGRPGRSRFPRVGKDPRGRGRRGAGDRGRDLPLAQGITFGAWELLALSGDREGARRLLAAVESRFAAEPIPRAILVRGHFVLGEKDVAFAWLEKAVEERDQSARTLKASSYWDPMRSEPRFQALLARMNLK